MQKDKMVIWGGLTNNWESEESEENANHYERNCIINISLVELKKGEYYIQFLKEKGELEYYYEKFLEIKNIIKKIEAWIINYVKLFMFILFGMAILLNENFEN